MQASDLCPHRFAAAQNARIWAASVLTGIEPAVAPNGPGVIADRRSWSGSQPWRSSAASDPSGS
jgi:hypothetical protein